MTDVSAKIKELRPYILNLKALLGIGAIIFSIYVSTSSIPDKWGQFWSARSNNDKLEDSKQHLSAEEAKLHAISKELDNLTTKIVAVEPDSSPELMGIKIAQDVVKLCESSKNTYVSLKPNTSSLFDINSAVKLPISVEGATPTQAAATPASSPGSSSLAAAPGAPGSPAAPSATASPGANADPKTSVKVFNYTLSAKGSYATLSTFIYGLSKLSDFVIVTSINLSASDSGSDAPPEPSSTDIKQDITMKLDFAVPWK